MFEKKNNNIKLKVKCVIMFALKSNSRVLLVSQTDNPTPKLTPLVELMLLCGRDFQTNKTMVSTQSPSVYIFRGK